MWNESEPAGTSPGAGSFRTSDAAEKNVPEGNTPAQRMRSSLEASAVSSTTASKNPHGQGSPTAAAR